MAHLNKSFRHVSFNYLLHSKDYFENALATLASMSDCLIELKWLINVEIGDEPAYCHNGEAESDGKPWFHDI